MTALVRRVLRLDGGALVALAVAGIAAFTPGAPPEARSAALFGVVVVAGLLLLPAVDPIRRLRWDDKPLPRMRLVAAVGAAAVALLLAGPLSAGSPDEVRRLLMLALVGFLGVAGNVFPALPRNRYFGVRTPWTIRDDRVWARTHRVFGHLLVGAMAVLAALWPLLDAGAFETAFGVVGLSLGAGSIAYSWLLSRRLPPLA